MLQYELRISGSVQGVGFRYYTQNQAKILNLTGWVRNTVDGSVLALVQGKETAIETLIDFLWIGPPQSQVRNIIKTEVPIFEEFSDFEVRT